MEKTMEEIAEDLFDFSFEVCPLHRHEDLMKIARRWEKELRRIKTKI